MEHLKFLHRNNIDREVDIAISYDNSCVNLFAGRPAAVFAVQSVYRYLHKQLSEEQRDPARLPAMSPQTCIEAVGIIEKTR
jgi:hypothetical protein